MELDLKTWGGARGVEKAKIRGVKGSEEFCWRGNADLGRGVLCWSSLQKKLSECDWRLQLNLSLVVFPGSIKCG